MQHPLKFRNNNINGCLTRQNHLSLCEEVTLSDLHQKYDLCIQQLWDEIFNNY